MPCWSGVKMKPHNPEDGDPFEWISIDYLLVMREHSDEVQIIDLRTHSEFYGGHLRGSIHIPFDKFTEEKAEELVKRLADKQDIVFLSIYSKQKASSCASQYAWMRVKHIENN